MYGEMNNMSTEKNEANVKICKEAHKMLKLYCINNNLNIKEAANKILFDFFNQLESADNSAIKNKEIKANKNQ